MAQTPEESPQFLGVCFMIPSIAREATRPERPGSHWNWLLGGPRVTRRGYSPPSVSRFLSEHLFGEEVTIIPRPVEFSNWGGCRVHPPHFIGEELGSGWRPGF